MTETTEQVRETLTTQSREVEVPPFDEVRFRSEVRRARRRRAGRLALGGTLASGVAAVALIAVPPLLEGEGGVDGREGSTGVAGHAGPELHPEALRAPLFFSAGGRLVAATPDGQVHDLGRSESVVGFTAEGALATDAQSRLVWVGASSSGEGDGSFVFERGAGPVTLPTTGPVQSAALSLDGRYLAWLDLEDQVTMWDLKANELVYRADVPRNAYVTSVSERGVLVSLNGNLTLLGVRLDVSVPTAGDGYGWVSDVAGDWVTVVDRDDMTRIYDVTREKAELVDSVPGTGRLAPYANGIVAVSAGADEDGGSGEAMLYLVDGEPTLLEGVGGKPQSAGWLDEDYAVVATAEVDGTVLYLCPVAEAACTPVAFSEEDVRLAE